MSTISQTTWQPSTNNTYLWYGYNECTEEDIEDLKAFCAGGAGSGGYPRYPVYEESTLKGRLFALWHAKSDPLSADNRAGGIKSRVYENQIVDPIVSEDEIPPDNVLFRPENDPMWYKDSDGNDVHGVPPNSGAYHEAYVGDGYYDYVEGPRPGSQAEAILGDGKYVWDNAQLLWRVE
jgi:hypothetical protein